MLKVYIFKVESPSCLWGRVVCAPGGNAEAMEQYTSLQAQMNVFYHGVTQDLHRLKPTSLEEGQVCVVYWTVKKSWCRAVVQSIITDPTCRQAVCFLVDHGEVIVVPLEKIRVSLQKFVELPFWVKKFHLARIKPITLRVSVLSEKAELEPSSHWDCSAALYLHNLLRASTQTEAVLYELDSESTSVELYLTISHIKICVNDDLVANRFACYSSCGLDACDRSPLMLSPSILSPTVSKCPHKQTLQHLHLPSEQGVSSETSDSSEAAELLTAPSSPQKGQNDDLNNYQPKKIEVFEAKMEQEPHPTSILSEAKDLKEPVECGQKIISKGDRICSRFLEWLNPEPFNSDTDDEAVLLNDTSVKDILVHSALSVEPCNTLEEAPITDSLRQVCHQTNYSTLSPADRYSWPAVAHGCNSLIISNNADQPLCYLFPLLSHIHLNSILLNHLSSSGPIAVLLCPGWEKAQVVYDLLMESDLSQILHPAIVLVGIGKDEAKAVKIPRNCLVLVTTPFTVVRLLSCHCFLFLRMYHLVLDEADQLFTLAPDQMATILQHFQKVSSSEEKASCPWQLVVAAKRWTSHMEGLISSHMPNPSIVISLPEEAALYGKIQQVILMTLESNKLSVLLGALDFSPDVGQKTLIVANSAQEIEDVFKAVSSKSAFCLKTHEGLQAKHNFVIQQWRKAIGPGTHVILVTTSECLKILGIRDAACVVHYGFPSSPKLFGSRLFCMTNNFRNLSKQEQNDGSTQVSRSVLLISERNARHVVGVLRYLERTDTPLPSILLTFTEGVHVAREGRKMDRPFCRYLKSFGFCRDRSMCPDRHRFNSELDQPAFPESGVAEVLPLYIKTASVFYGRLVRQNDKQLDMLATEMMYYYADKKPGAKELLEGALYAVQEEEVFHRVKIVSLPDHGEGQFYNVLVQFIDIGKESDVRSHQLFELPPQFHSLPNQAIEMVICRVKPIDAEIEWHPKVTRAISQKIRGLKHQARVILCLGDTVFVDHMVRVTQIPDTKSVIYEYSVQSEILKTGMGVSNPEHPDLLRALCQDSLVNRASTGLVSEEEILAEAFRVVELKKTLSSDSSHQMPNPCIPITATNQCTVHAAAEPEDPLLSVCNQKFHSNIDYKKKDVNPSQSIVSVKDGGDISENNNAACLRPHENGVADGEEPPVSSLYPRLVWYQTCDSVIVTVKLMNPESQRCDFYADRVVYSGRENGRFYRADLELYQEIAADSCHWEMKSNQPVLKLVKQQPGYWERLVRSKNIFVSYDMEHVDEEEGGSSSCLWFVENTGEDGCYTISESGSESD